MIYYLLKEFKKQEKDHTIQFSKLGAGFWIKIIILFIPICFYSYFSIYKNNIFLSLIGFFAMLVTGYFFFKNTEKVIEKKFGSEFERYKERLDLFRGVLNNQGLYTGMKIKYLIEINDNQKESWKFSSNILNHLY